MTGISIQYILIAVLYLKCLVGFTVNVIIVASNFMKWKSLKSLPTCDQILSSLAISRGLCFFTIFVRNFLYQFCPWLVEKNVVRSALHIQTMFTFYSSHWFATILCVFYCVKIATYNYKLFIFLKTRISTMVPWLIQASLMISLLSSLPFHWPVDDIQLENLSNCSTENISGYGHVTVPKFNDQFLIFAAGFFLPFVIFCVAIILLIYFLLMHTRQMRSNGSHVQSPNLDSHFSALKSLSLLFLLQVIFFIYMNLFASGKLFKLKFSMLISWLMLSSSPLFHSLYLISSSSELRKLFVSKCLGLTRYS